MVKRHNTGRRQILQLEDKKPPPAPSSKGSLSRALIQYSDSDDESKNSPRDSEHSVSLASEGPSGSTVAPPIDSQVADFLKEIDALSVVEQETDHGSSEAEPKLTSVDDSKPSAALAVNSNSKKQKHKNEESNNKESAQPISSAGSSDMYCLWQECRDHSTGYTYYWNVQTNDVTWECPKEYLDYIKYLSSNTNVIAAQSSTSADTKTNKATKKKQEVKLREGAIIPISYFGDSSSSECSSDEDSNHVAPDSQVSSKNKSDNDVSLPKKRIKNAASAKINKPNVEIADTIGPQLPANFQFPKEVDSVSPQPSSTDCVPIDNEECVIIGPQLPPDFIASSNLEVEKSEDKEEQDDDESEIYKMEQSEPPVSSVVAESSSQEVKEEEPWEEALMGMEKEFNLANLEAHQTNDVPDSTTRKENASLKILQNNCEKAKISLGKISVVAYDSDSETEEQENSSSSNQGSPIVEDQQELKEELKEASSMEIDFEIEAVQESKEEKPFQLPSSSKASKNYVETVSVDAIEVSTAEEVSKPTISSSDFKSLRIMNNRSESPYSTRYPKTDYDDIVNNMFSFAHENDGKFGFGFSKQQQLEIEDSAFNNTEVSSKRKTRKGCSKINFVKSDNILDLNTVNESSLPSAENLNSEPGCSTENKDDSNGASSIVLNCSAEEQESIAENSIVLKSENIPSPSNAELQELKEKLPVTEVLPLKTENSNKDSETNISMNKILSKEDLMKLKGKKLARKRKEESEPSSKKLKKESSETNGDIDYIDKLLNDILHEKQAMNSSKKSSETSPTVEKTSKLSNKDTKEANKVKSRKKAESKSDEKKEENVSEHAEEILDLATLLLNKLNYLLSSHSNMTALSNLVVQIQTRLVDWQAGALSRKYFADRLEDVNEYLRQYESGIVSGDWRCQWDRENKRYFYVNLKTQHSQWSFPSELFVHNEVTWTSQPSDIPTSSVSTYQSSTAQFPLVSSSMCEDQKHERTSALLSVKDKNKENKESSTSSSKHLHHSLQRTSSPPPPPPGVESPPPLPPPPSTSPPLSPPLPPPDSTEFEDGEIPGVDMDIENSNSSDSVSFVNHGVSNSAKSGQSFKQLSFECSSTRSPDHPLRTSMNVVSSTSTIHSEHGFIAKPPQPLLGMDAGVNFLVNPMPWSSSFMMPSCSTSQNFYHIPPMLCNVVPSASLPSTSSNNNESLDLNPVSTATSIPSSSSSAQKTSSSSSTQKTSSSSSTQKTSTSTASAPVASKKEKKKTKLQAGLALKKKNIPSLVQKWQKIKKDQEKEDKLPEEARISTSMK